MTASAAAAAGTATETDPELSDPPGDVAYSATHVGPKDHDYLDILSAWFDYNETQDVVGLRLKMGSLVGARAANGFQVLYSFHAEGFRENGGKAGTFGFLISKDHGTGKLNSSGSFTGASGQGNPLAHEFGIAETKPGVFYFNLTRSTWLGQAEGVRKLLATSGEKQYVQGIDSGVANSDRGDSSREYSFMTLRPAASSHQSATPGNSSSESPTDSADEATTPGFTVVLLAGVILGVVFWAGRR